MFLFISRKVFLGVAGGNASAQRHFEDTIQHKRTLDEVRRFLPTREIENLEKIFGGLSSACKLRAASDRDDRSRLHRLC